MIHLESLFRSLKAVWIHRLKTSLGADESWARVSHFIMSQKYNLECVVNFSFDPSKTLPGLYNMSSFYKEVIESFAYSNNEYYK